MCHHGNRRKSKEIQPQIRQPVPLPETTEVLMEPVAVLLQMLLADLVAATGDGSKL